MSHENPSCHDCTDFDEPAVEDRGCCSPAPTRHTCDAPVLPVQQCPDEVTEMTYDPETEEYILIAQLLDQNCEPILDQNSDPILTPII